MTDVNKRLSFVYRAAQNMLLVETGERIYEYFDISQELYTALVESQDESGFFNRQIWNRYEYRCRWQTLAELCRYVEACELIGFDPPVTAQSHNSFDNDNLLHLASTWGDLEAVDLLIAAGVPVNGKGDLNCTPLYNAVTFGHVRCAKRLLEAGATSDNLNGLNMTERERALALGKTEMLALFK